MLKLSVQSVLLATSALFFVSSSAGWCSGKRDIVIGVGGIGFDSQASRIEYCVANSLMLLRQFFEVQCCVAQAMDHGVGFPHYLLHALI